MDIREFKDTYTKYAPAIIWDWCAKPTAEEIDYKLCEFSEMGISRVYIRPSKGLVLPYLSGDYFELIRTAARRGGKYGISLGICDENSSSSGNGGGEITSVADYRMRDILKVSKNDVDKNDVIISEASDSTIVLRDMSRMRASGRAPLADITDAFVTGCFTETVYDKYIKECKRFIGMEIKEFMTQIALPYDALLYSSAAQKNAGISDLSLLIDANNENRRKYDIALSECIASDFTGCLREKCHNNNLLLSVSTDFGTNISAQMQYIKADSISLSIDSNTPDFTQLKLAQTICEQYDKPFYIRLLLPSFAPCSERYNKAAQFTAFGADGIIFDSVAFSLSDRRKYEPHTVAVSKFAEKDISERLSRLAFLTSNTDTCADLLIIYNHKKKKESDALIQNFIKNGVRFHILEENMFRKYACVSHGSIVSGKCRYDNLIVSDMSFSVPEEFTGTVYTINEAEKNLSQNVPALQIDGDCIINSRDFDDNNLFFITVSDDTAVTFSPDSIPVGKKLFAADCSNGEIYAISAHGNECKFTIKKGKTAVLLYSSSISADIAPPFTDDIEFAPHEKLYDVPFVLSSADENILPLKNANVCFGRKSYRESNIDALHKEFYSLRDGETVKVKYPFSVDLQNIGRVKAYIENAENLDFAELNGKKLCDFVPSDKDPRFMGTDVTNLLSDGKNTFAVEYKKSNNYTPDFASITPSHFYSYNITSFEPIYLCGDFDCNESTLFRLESYEDDITQSGMSYYYGSLTYAVKLPEKDLSGSILTVNGNFDICRIRIGKRSHTFFCETPMLEVFNLDCDAVAEITVYNTPFNLLRTAEKQAVAFGIQGVELCKFKY